ncbi:MAG: NAD(P)/FAD-dependent oxidoreductase [Ilumatobacteraceae bacterium]
MTTRPQVVVIGAGFGGTRVVRALRDADVRLTLIDRNNFHTFQPLLYQVATAGLDVGDVTFPVRTLLRHHRDASFVMGSVTAIDLDARTVTVDGQTPLAYDFLVVGAGSVSASFGVPGVDEHTLPLKDADDAIRLRNRLIGDLEAASRAVGRGERQPELGLVIVGGGPTGIETAGGMRELLDKVLAKDYPELGLRGLPITVVEGGPRLLGAFDPRSSDAAVQALHRRGIDVRLGAVVDHVEPGVVVLKDGTRLPAGIVVWAAGVAASPLATMLGSELERGRVKVQPNLSLPGHAEVFAIGDIAAVPGPDGKLLPQVAQPAIQEGRHVAAEIVAAQEGRASIAFEYTDKGSMATIGRNQAVVEFPNGRHFHGWLGWVMWLGLHILYLMGFRNRVSTLVNWSWNYLTYDRGARVLARTSTPVAPAAPKPKPRAKPKPKPPASSKEPS